MSTAYESQLSTVELLQAMFPLPQELTLSSTTQDFLDSLNSPSSPPSYTPPTVIDLTISVEIEPEYILDVKVELPLQSPPSSNANVDAPSSPPTLTLIPPTWLSSASFASLQSAVSPPPPSTSPDDAENDPTAPIFSLIERLRSEAPAFLPRSTAPGSTPRTSLDSVRSFKDDSDKAKMGGGVKESIIAISKMHHIVNQPKLRRLKALAETHNASGFVKSGRPGVMLYELESKDHLSKFLEAVRGLKYMEFHHLTSSPILPQTLPPSSCHPSPSSSKPPHHPKSKAAAAEAKPVRLREDGKAGLIEVDEMKELMVEAERVGRKEWFREAMGMTGGGGKG